MKTRLEELVQFVEETDVPLVYWKRAGIADELQRTLREVREELERLTSVGDSEFEEILWRFLVSSSLLNRITDNTKRASVSPDLAEVVASARFYLSSQKGGRKTAYQKLESYTRGWAGQYPSIGEIRHANQRIITREEQDARQSARVRSTIRVLFMVLLVVVSVTAAGIGMTEYIRKLKREKIVAPPPVVITQIVEKLITAVPTDTTFAEGALIVPTEASRYSYQPLDNIVPASPYGLTPVYLIDDSKAYIEDGYGLEWMEGESGIGGKHIYLVDVPEDNMVRALWELDQAIPASGRYEIFALDPYASGGCDNPLTYEVLLNDVMAQPLSGSRTVFQKAAEAQTGDEWISVGIYQFQAGEWVKVQSWLPANSDVSCSFGIDAVLFSRLPELDLEVVFPLVSPDVYDLDILFTADSADARYEPDEILWTEQETNTGNWGGVRYIDIQEDNVLGHQVIYEFSHPVFPGDYELWVWMPAEAQAAVEFMLDITYSDGSPVPETAYLYRIDTIDPVMESFQGRALRLVAMSLDQEVTVRVVASPGPDVSGRFAVDDLFLVRVTEGLEGSD